jgi:hypothetical protein
MLVLAGFFFIWKKGVFDWAHSVQADKKAVARAEARRAA